MFGKYFLEVVFGIVLLWLAWKLLQSKRAEYIRDYKLPPGLFEKLRKKHPHLSQKDCQLVGHALRQFFIAYLKAQKKDVAMPSQAVDDLWHEFILYTRNYAQFCRRAFGGFLHHTPAVMMSKAQGRNDGLARCWWQACREEDINPRLPTRLPLLFAIDRKLSIDGGFFYLLDCTNEVELAKVSSLGGPIHCATTLATMFPERDRSRSGSGCSNSSCSGNSLGCSGNGCSGGCSGGCGGGD
jgi:hypothetical protein